MATSEKQAAKADNKDVQKQADEIEAKGYIGQKADPVPNEEYTLTTGPASPPYLSDDRSRVNQPIAGEEAQNDA